MPRKQTDVEKSLQAKGFRSREGDHNYFNYYSKAGKKTAVFTKTSHGSREIDESLLSLMAKQCKLSNKDFGLLIDCPLDRDTYEANSSHEARQKLPPPNLPICFHWIQCNESIKQLLDG